MKKNKKWLQAVGQIPCCVLCGKYGIQVAHRNVGKGMGMKTPDYMTAALCPECHYEIDNGNSMTRNERQASMDRAIVLTHEQLIKMGVCGLLI